jgi:hypothetical protein
MQFKTYLQSKLPLYLALGSLFVLASCGSYQYVGNDSDGIYSSSKEVTTTEEIQPTNNDNSYYKGYFEQKSQKYEQIAQDDKVIFTDIDDYEGTYNEASGEVEYTEGYAGWGQNPDNIVINVYDNNQGWYNWGYPSNNWGWNWGWGFGYNNWGWNNGWGYGYNHWGWINGWNNWGWNSGFGWCAPYYGYGGYYGFNQNHIAYNSTRRGNYTRSSGRNSSQYDGRRNSSVSNSSVRNSTVRNSSNTRYNPANSIRSNTRSNSNIRSNQNIRSNNTRSNTRINTPSSNVRSNTRVNSPSSSTRSSSSSSVRSSGSSRSSSGGSRSSGGSSRRGG